MRLSKHTATGAVALAAAMAAGPALAATSPEQLCQGGQLAAVRISTLKSPASKPQYDKAARDHLAWYRNHGHKENRVMGGPVLVFDRRTGQWAESPTEFASVHLNSPGIPPAQRDAAWDAYVAGYRASSDLTVDKFVCLREPGK